MRGGDAAIATHQGHSMPEACMAECRASFTDRAGGQVAFLPRDIEAGRPC